jgi:hypothetical protein
MTKELVGFAVFAVIFVSVMNWLGKAEYLIGNRIAKAIRGFRGKL